MFDTTIRWLISLLFFVALLACSKESMIREAETVKPMQREWTQFRGPDRSGIADGESFLSPWPADGLTPLWKVAAGPGFSGIAYSDERVYTMFADDSTEFLAALNPANGQEIWRTAIGTELKEMMGDGPRSTPTVDGDLVYALGSFGGFYAINKVDGTIKWHVSFEELFQSARPRRGFCTSPLVDGDLVLLEVGGQVETVEEKRVFHTNIAAFNKLTGEKQWSYHLTPGAAGPSSPLVTTIDDVRQYIFATSRKLLSIGVDGAVLWEHPIPPGVIAMPVLVDDNKIFVSSSTDLGCKLVQIESEADSIKTTDVWSNRVLRNHFSSSLYHNGYLYGFSNAQLRCVDVATGKHTWVKRGYGKGSLIMANDHLIIITDRGKLVLGNLSPETFEEISVFQALSGKSWTAPVIADGKIYVRNLEEMVCYDLPK